MEDVADAAVGVNEEVVVTLDGVTSVKVQVLPMLLHSGLGNRYDNGGQCPPVKIDSFWYRQGRHKYAHMESETMLRPHNHILEV